MLCRSKSRHSFWFPSTLTLIALAIVGCPSEGPSGVIDPPKKVKAAPADPWVLATLDPENSVPAYLSNGTIGVRFDRAGLAPDSGGLFLISAYQTSGEEKIIELPNLCLGQSKELNLARCEDYRQTLDMRTGILETSWKRNDVEVTTECVVHPTLPIIAQRIRISSGNNRSISFSDPAFESSNTNLTSWQTKRGNVTYQISQKTNTEPPKQSNGGLVIDVTAGHPFELTRIVTAADDRIQNHPDGSLDFESIAKLEKVSLDKRWKTDIEIDGPVEDQQAIRSFLFYLRNSIAKDGTMAISPFALSNQQYNGHVFWDADIWVFPSLALTDPDLAKVIPNYRLRHLKSAEQYMQKWLVANRPIIRGELGKATGTGAKFPWESSVSGFETTPTSSRFEDHISGSVAFAVKQASSLGLVSASQSNDLLNKVTEYWKQRITKTKRGLEVHGVMSPDENHTGDNDLYTNLLAQWCLSGGQFDANSQAFLPRDKVTFLTYENDPFRGYKQAAAILAIYPLQFPKAENEAMDMMKRYAGKVTKNGPAMSDSVHATVWARFGEPEKAYETWRDSWKEFTKSPLMLFSEKRSKPVTYFTTGAAGSLQTVLYGFLGFRIDSKHQINESWSKKLVGDAILSVKPNLPKAWKSVKFKNFSVLGQRFTLTSTPTETTVTQGE